MQPKTRKVTAAILAVGFVLLDRVGSIFIGRLKNRIKDGYINKYNLENRSILKERYGKYLPYNSNLLKRREVMSISKVNPPIEWTDGQFFIEEHDASHFHHDLSIIVNGKVYRMARTPSEGNLKSGFMGLFPGPGEKSGWILQPEHYVYEVPNPAVIDDGYGAGTSTVVAKGKCLVRISPSGNLDVIFEGIDGVYSFVEKGNQSLMIRKFTKGPGIGKHKMKVGKNAELSAYISNNDIIFVPKYNGAAVDWEVVRHTDGHKYLRIYSWRPDKKLANKYQVENQIDHTHRLVLCDQPLGDDFPICKGRGELWVAEPHGLLKINGVLNSGTFVSRNNPDNQKLILVVHDLVKHQDFKEVYTLPYEDKLKIMAVLEQMDDRFWAPVYTDDPDRKKLMWDTLIKDPSYDGVIIWEKGQFERPTKMKFKHEESFWHQGVIVRLEPQLGQHSDKYMYPIIQNEEGAEFKCAGKGLTQEIKADMYNNPKKYIGRGVYYSAEHHFPDSGLPFQPVLVEIL